MRRRDGYTAAAGDARPTPSTPRMGQSPLDLAQGLCADRIGARPCRSCWWCILGAGKTPRRAHRAAPRPIPASSTMRRRASARRRILPASCSSPWPASTSCMCRFARRTRRSTPSWAARSQMMFSIASTAVAQMSGGTVRGIAVTSLTPRRSFPACPRSRKPGLPGFSVIGWNGFVAPKGTSPADHRQAQCRALQRGLDDPELRQRLASAGYEPAARNSPDEFARIHPVRHDEMGRPGGKDQYEGSLSLWTIPKTTEAWAQTAGATSSTAGTSDEQANGRSRVGKHRRRLAFVFACAIVAKARPLGANVEGHSQDMHPIGRG